MSVLQLYRVQVGEVGVVPGTVKMLTTDNLASVTTAGYLNNTGTMLAQVLLAPTDVIECIYGYNTSTGVGTYETFTVSISAGVVTLVAWVDPGNVLLPVVSGNFAIFNGTTGQIKDAGYLPTDATKTRVVMANAAVTANALAVYADALGTIKDQSTTATLAFGLTIATGAITAPNLKYGSTPVAQVDPQSCTISAVAGAANTATITIQLKDGSGTNITYSSPFRVYSSSASNGLTLQSAASTGYSVASGGLSLANGSAVTTQINGVTSATGGCVLSLLDTGKQTSYLVLVLHNGVKISAQLSAGSYG